MLSGVGRGMGVLEGVNVAEENGWFWGFLAPIGFSSICLIEMYSTRA